ncbi:hypothetical protein A1342_19170 [Methylomonas methanica]|uniref:Defence against restriction A N-terminal domain-containing protein n=2 Tax=Methylomonas TaxID=416 RepID=A0A140E5E9_9GAMM|nr:hypothetical protein JT25_003830 [Methylomonas denitrificans]OAI08030.1 hypothetical protein A1342_19170 [Methylomonas methanica]
MTIAHCLYEIQRADAADRLVLDSVTMADILAEADEILLLDALVSTYAKLQRKMEMLQTVMERVGGDVKPIAMQLSDPFKQNGVAQVAAVFELSDGQTVSIFFHNPDVTPSKIAPTDELISWKWLLNKKDLTILVAPEKGMDLNIREVTARVMKLAAKNSAAFQRANVKRAENLAVIESLKAEIPQLEKELKRAQHQLEVAKIEAEQRAQRREAMENIPDYANPAKRYVAVKIGLVRLGWAIAQDGMTLVDKSGTVAVKQELVGNNHYANIARDWAVYQKSGATWKKVDQIADGSTKTLKQADEVARLIDVAASKISPQITITKPKRQDPIKAAFIAELEGLKVETDIEAYNNRLDDIAARVESAGLMEELDAELNATADVLTDLLFAAEKCKA